MAYSIVAERDTVIKQRPVDSSQLSELEKFEVQKGKKFVVSDFNEVQPFHWRVTIDNDSWYIFDASAGGKHSHWRCSWENDKNEKEDLNPPAAVSSDTYIPGNKLTPDKPFNFKITPNFSYGEFALFQEERRFDYQHQCDTAYRLAVFLEQIRSHFDKNPVIITSAYRPPKINKLVGGASRSEHLYRAPNFGAVDIYVKNVDIKDVQDYCIKNWPYSVGKGANRGFVHIGIRGNKERIIWNYSRG